ncbi:MAG: FIVAR domain-containing protein [Bacteroidaceae bacterium]|nr:FIVAR domain-containing protein [Bacteroidaceae bacterium]
MKKIFTLVACLTVMLTAGAQTWKLTEMTDDVFARGGDTEWSFQKYTYETGLYTEFTVFDELSTVNYVDIYQPERVGGMPVQDITGVTPNAEFTWANNFRYAWYDTEWTIPTRTNANEKFVYVSRLRELDNAFEVCGNQQYVPAISFTAPADGYYKVSGTVIRQDGANLRAINVVPRYRYKGAEEVNANITMGFNFPFGEGGDFIPGVTNFRLADGGEQRYTAQEPTDFTFAFHAKKGDIVSLEVNYQSLPSSNWPRDYYPRSFYKRLDVEQVEQAVATAETFYSDPYDESVLTAIADRIDDYTDRLSELEYGSEIGQVPFSSWMEFDSLINQYNAWLEDGTINAVNAEQYLDLLEQAWQRLLANIIMMDYAAQGNYNPFSYRVQTDGTYELTADTDVMAENTNSPWGFYARVAANGTLELLENHDEENLSNESAWYRGRNQWFYITDNGALHPLVDRSPLIQFTAPEDGVYRLDLTVYRPTPNPSVENPLYIRWYHLYDGAETATTDNLVLSQQYGSVANDGEGGKKPVSTAFYAYLKAGDRVAFEEDCYTSGRNSSAGTQILHLSACSRISDEEAITVQTAKESGLLFVNPYAAGDVSALRETIARAEEVLAATVVGTEPGQYPEEARQTLLAVLDEARQYVELEGDPRLTQSVVDQMTRDLEKAIEAYLVARNPITLQPSGDYAIQLAGTDKYLTKKNQAAGEYYYATVDTYDAILADVAKNYTAIEEYSWTFTITPVEGTNDVTITTPEGYMTPDAYIARYQGEGLDPEVLPSFTFVQENPGDSLFAIRRNSDGLYWTGSIEWKSPYNKVATSASPQYIWKLSDITVEYITPVIAVTEEPVAVRTELFDLSGRRVNGSARGVLIRRTTLGDGSVRTNKIMK